VLQDFLIYTTFETGNVSALHVFEKSTERETNRGGLRHLTNNQPYDVIVYDESKQPLYNSKLIVVVVVAEANDDDDDDDDCESDFTVEQM